ncbi:MAG TPA: FAD-linked oxidase C-terminal domain-containing protein [Candidatus Gastranaerophilales bacterium]|nr:FAD-linked oxidase C-terminal domain-containing protein [Candidatus Gastranaerophilales bacterium]
MLEYKTKLEKKIISELKAIAGANNVLEEYEDRYCYAYDATAIGDELYLPDAVILPENKEQISLILKIANKNRIPVITRGAGTNLVGGCIALKGGIVLHTSKMNKIIHIDKNNLLCQVEPGVVIEKLQQEAEKLGLFYPPDPASLRVSTIGGSIAQSSGGPRGFKYGTTKDYVLGLEAVMADGTIIKTGGKTVKNVTGYNLTQLLVGSEGTLGVITEATLRLIPKPEERQVLLACFESADEAVNAVTGIISAKITPSTLDIMDKNTMQTIEKFHKTGLPTDMDAVLVIEVDGFKESVSVQADQIVNICNEFGAKNIRASKNQQEADEIWFARRSAFGAVSRLRPNVFTEDAVVPRDKIPEMFKEIRRIANKYDLTVCIMGHIGDGNIHPNFSLDLRDKDEAKRFEKAAEEIFNSALSFGGTLSGEHGIGYHKLAFMKKALGEKNIEIMQAIKNIFDPNSILNPGKVV